MGRPLCRWYHYSFASRSYILSTSSDFITWRKCNCQSIVSIVIHYEY